MGSPIVLVRARHSLPLLAARPSASSFSGRHLLTLPERLILALYLRLRGRAIDRRPAPVFILGYYRSGTTFLQFLLNCDPNLYSPRRRQTFSPQGFFPELDLPPLLHDAVLLHRPAAG